MPVIKKIPRQTITYPNWMNKKINKLGNANQPIYKYYRLDHLISALINKELWINQVKRWDDVYENFLFKQPLIHLNQPAEWIEFSENIYGQCWTFKKSSDAMWRIYSSEPKTMADLGLTGIRVATTPKKLWEAIYTSDLSGAISHIGKVHYKTDSDILSWLQSHQALTTSPNLTEVMFESLCIKRTPFDHEEEIRILTLFERTPYITQLPDFLAYDIDPTIFFDEFVIEPRITDPNMINAIISQLQSLAPSVHVRQSNLYRLNHQVTIHLD